LNTRVGFWDYFLVAQGTCYFYCIGQCCFWHEKVQIYHRTQADVLIQSQGKTGTLENNNGNTCFFKGNGNTFEFLKNLPILHPSTRVHGAQIVTDVGWQG